MTPPFAAALVLLAPLTSHEITRVFIEAQSWTAHLREHRRSGAAASEGEQGSSA